MPPERRDLTVAVLQFYFPGKRAAALLIRFFTSRKSHEGMPIRIDRQAAARNLMGYVDRYGGEMINAIETIGHALTGKMAIFETSMTKNGDAEIIFWCQPSG